MKEFAVSSKILPSGFLFLKYIVHSFCKNECNRNSYKL